MFEKGNRKGKPITKPSIPAQSQNPAQFPFSLFSPSNRNGPAHSLLLPHPAARSPSSAQPSPTRRSPAHAPALHAPGPARSPAPSARAQPRSPAARATRYHGPLGPIHQVISPAPRRARAGPPASSTPRQRTARPTDSPDPPVIPFLSPFHFPRRRLCSRSFPCAAPSLCAVDQPEIVARSPARAPLLEASPELGQARSLGEIRFPREPSRPQSPLRPSGGMYAQILGRLLLFSTPVALRLLSTP